MIAPLRISGKTWTDQIRGLYAANAETALHYRRPVIKDVVVGEKGVEIRDVPKPAPAANENVIRARASSLNRADLIVASGQRHGSVGGVGARIGLE